MKGVVFVADNSLESAKTRRKSAVQTRKERERRRKVRELLETAINRNEFLSQTKIARDLGVSQATISRDLKTLGKSRWNPWRLLELKTRKETEEYKRQQREWIEDFVSGLSTAESFRLLTMFMAKRSGAHYYPQHSRPRGRPFTSSYQPRECRKTPLKS